MENTSCESNTNYFHLLMHILVLWKIIDSATSSTGKSDIVQYADHLMPQPGKFAILCSGICTSAANCLV